MVGKPKKAKSAPVPKAPEPLPPVPIRTDAQTQELAKDQRIKIQNRPGRTSTILTGGLGTEQATGFVRFLGGSRRT